MLHFTLILVKREKSKVKRKTLKTVLPVRQSEVNNIKRHTNNQGKCPRSLPMNTIYITFYLLCAFSLSLPAQPTPAPEDTLAFAESVTPADSSLPTHLQIKSLRPKSFVKSERMMQFQLRKLVFLTSRRYPTEYLTTEQLFEEMNRLPEPVKKQVLSLAVAGGMAQQVLRISRKYLARYGVAFLRPTMDGLHIYSPLTSLRSHVRLSLLGPADFYLSTSFQNGLIHGGFRSTPYYFQKSLNLKVSNRLSLLGLETDYRQARYRSLGLAHYSKTISFYAVYQKNLYYPDHDRAYLSWSLTFD